MLVKTISAKKDAIFIQTRYKVDAMPLSLCSRQTLPSSDCDSRLSSPRLITEAFYLLLTSWEACIEPNGGFTDGGGEGVVLWYMGCIASNAMTDVDASPAGGNQFIAHLLAFEEAMEKLKNPQERAVFRYCSERSLGGYPPQLICSRQIDFGVCEEEQLSFAMFTVWDSDSNVHLELGTRLTRPV
ncbi:hypothetical protein PQX77_015328 [Marasmius sp. AFHP31]|nr:hypothetical protein PQX77_015328 [Marasmius sp. AFHP31]